MAPKKAKKISLNEFLGDSTLGSWADEMESLPNAPAPRIEEENSGDRYGRRDDFSNSRPERQNAPPREDIPLPTQPPYTAFVGNLAFDLTEIELEQFFTGIKTKSVKIIRDKDEKPKGFGYVEFEEVEGLKEALVKSGSNFSGRTIRVSVAEPPKERGGFAGASEDNAKFDNPWRRDGPLPDLPNSREPSRRRFDGPPADRQGGQGGDRQAPSVADGQDQWRSTRPARSSEAEPPLFKRKGSGFLTPDTQIGAADKEDSWTIGSKFKATSNGLNDEGTGRFGGHRIRSEMGPPKDVDEGDWRSAPRPIKAAVQTGTSPSTSTPPTPQLARRKLELLPRSGSVSVSPSPMSSPKMGPTPPASGHSKANPFGEARPVDVSARDKEVSERLDRERDMQQEKLTMSRTSSRTGVDRGLLTRPQTPPVSSALHPQSKQSPAKASGPSLVPTVRPSLSFANAAAKKETISRKGDEPKNTETVGQSEDAANA